MSNRKDKDIEILAGGHTTSSNPLAVLLMSMDHTETLRHLRLSTGRHILFMERQTDDQLIKLAAGMSLEAAAESLIDKKRMEGPRGPEVTYNFTKGKG